MAAPRAVWKGFLKVGSVACGVKLVGAVTQAGKIHFKVLNREDRTPVRSVYVDEDTNEVVPAEDQIKGFELDKGGYIHIEPEEIKKLRLTTDHTLEVESFVPVDQIDQRYLEKPYYLIPADRVAEEAFAMILEAMALKKVAARSCVVLYQRGREVLIQPYGKGMLVTELRNHNEIIPAKSVFEGMKLPGPDRDLLDVASMLIDKKPGKFEPEKFEDRYEEALAAAIEAKRKGKKITAPKRATPKSNVVDLADVLRRSLEQEGGTSAPKKKRA